ncbi:MAG: alpha/beta hydrolase [Ruminococcaceae bacterium]|nr:alpha/beta hydrolase [Oscillospiraceae bacterium]
MTYLYVALGLVALLLVVAFGCFWLTFYNPTLTDKRRAAQQFPPGRVYQPYHGVLRRWTEELDATPYEPMEVTTPDGLTLRGRYYELTPDTPVEILFHGYRGFSERDMAGALERCRAVGHSLLLVDQRAHGRSDGHVITFGAREKEDVFLWLEAAHKKWGERPTMIGGVSMGCTTVLLAAGEGLPERVFAVLADCGYTNAKDIICKVIRQLHLPAWLLYPLVRLGAVLYGGFDPNRVDAVVAVARCAVPVIFYHGDADDFVPYEMGRINFEACAAPKRFVNIPGAGHGLCYPADKERYVSELKAFLAQHESAETKQ